MKDIVLIPGTWARASSWGSLPQALQDLGLRVHAPDLRYHDLAYEEVEKVIGDISIRDYVDDFVDLIESLETQPLILGHSLGGLIAQLVAAELDHAGLVLLGPAPSADIFALYPTKVHGFYKHFLRLGFWKKPMPPYRHTYYKYVANKQGQEVKDKAFADLVPESGRVYTEMGLAFLDKKKTTRVDHEKIQGPVLVITGSEDKIVVPAISKATAAKYKNSKLVMIEDSDHLYTSKRVLARTVEEIKFWMEENNIR